MGMGFSWFWQEQGDFELQPARRKSPKLSHGRVTRNHLPLAFVGTRYDTDHSLTSKHVAPQVEHTQPAQSREARRDVACIGNRA